ncbi:CDF family Co(II)/Ni(II) efflux transporter DmeF [Zavarzinia compransoris]|uniref:CDF family Co(II)/Ni(II) efflux transporter DmeF n=1 Tax=Zavarzinia marina TaxID=2911065 RepID=UPI001F18AAE4|nr:CDF family Co(II)/Ni(II) efflux transporter DmeF [Zavarzinia marina]MCF4166010.1 CDF family Co(II)/Ni(II) efflux transporter DmeF [Zavarzinia marina]
MAAQDISSHTHGHNFLGTDHRRNERRVRLVIALTATTMVVEIAAGTVYGSMALVADGWHMSTHAAAMLIAALTYLYARWHANDRRFSFGTGKLGDLGAFASAVILALVALLIGWESVMRLAQPVAIGFEQAIAVAVIGLAVNLACAWLLRDDHGHHHGHHHHDHDHGDDHHHHGRDNNLRAAYLHVLADALTSILAIVALLLGRAYGWLWADPLMGVVGALVIARWSWGLIRESGAVLLDRVPEGEDLAGDIRKAIETEADRITDLHVWQIGPGHHAAIVALVSSAPREPSDYKARLSALSALSHVTIEVEPAGAAG